MVVNWRLFFSVTFPVGALDVQDGGWIGSKALEFLQFWFTCCLTSLPARHPMSLSLTLLICKMGMARIPSLQGTWIIKPINNLDEGPGI